MSKKLNKLQKLAKSIHKRVKNNETIIGYTQDEINTLYNLWENYKLNNKKPILNNIEMLINPNSFWLKYKNKEVTITDTSKLFVYRDKLEDAYNSSNEELLITLFKQIYLETPEYLLNTALKQLDYTHKNNKLYDKNGTELDPLIYQLFINNISKNSYKNLAATINNYISFKNQINSYSVCENLDKFLLECDFNILDSGHIEAYKVVTENYLDKHSKTFDNSIGNIISMPRVEVDDNSRNTCSNGLHVAAKGYLQYFYSPGDRIIKVLVNISDFVAIPDDYSYTKARTCSYKVLEDVTTEMIKELNL